MNRSVAISKAAGLRAGMVLAWDIAKAAVESSPIVVTIRTRSLRSLEANRKMWAMLTDLSRQLEWPVNGYMEKLEPEDWKDILSAAAKGELRMAAGINGGFVFLGVRTSKMTIKAMNEMIECIYAFGSERDVVWSEPVPEEYFEYRECV